MATVSEKNGAGVRAQGVDESGAVILFIRAGFFVLLDDLIPVVFGMTNGD